MGVICFQARSSAAAFPSDDDPHPSFQYTERWFDLVIVLQCDNTVLYDRLEKRGYADKKIQENVECEIMQVTLEVGRFVYRGIVRYLYLLLAHLDDLQEAMESYKEEIVKPLQSNTSEEQERNVEMLVQWIKSNDS